VVATLAVGIGANAAIFTIVHGVLLRPLDYPRPDQLMYLTAESPAIGGTRNALSAPEYAEFRQMNQSFAAVGAYATGGEAYTTGEVNLTAGDRPLRVVSGAWRHYACRGLVIAQVAFAVMLVIGAGLLIQTVYNLINIDAGFDRSRLVTFSMTLPISNSEPDTRAQEYQRVLDRLRCVPGVLGAVAMSGLPPNRTSDAIATPIENYSSDDGRPSEVIDYYQFVMGDYFGTMGSRSSPAAASSEPTTRLQARWSSSMRL
jgi:hypothetical protein